MTQFSFKLHGTNYTADTLKELSEIYGGLRDESDEGSSTFPSPKVRESNKVIGHISYNGRVWRVGADGCDEANLLYDNRMKAS